MVTRTEGGVLVRVRGEERPPPSGTPSTSTRTRTAGRTVAAVVGLNLAIQVALVVTFVVRDADVVTAERVSLLAAVVFYALTAVAVRWRAAGLGLVPSVGREHPWAGMAEGVVVGMGAAVLFSALVRLALGRPVPDPTSAALASSGAVWLLAGAAVLAVLAPVVEELVFRGFLLEAFRPRGPHTAVVVSAVFFSVAHLQPAQLRYYAVMGAAFSLLYLRRGLVGSVAAHAAFNGTLLLVAVASVHAPVREVSAAGFTVSVPATWTASRGVPGDDLALRGPLGTTVELAHVDLRRPVAVDVLVRDLAGSAVPLPDDVRVDVGSVTRITLPAGPAVSASARIRGRPGRVTMVPRGTRLWVAGLRAPGDDHAARQFDDIVRSWRLP